ncbi:hypothetical protein [Dyadobacter sp. CY347]|uniref:hypothetical protein n=1 Tax=Dyadobacter sp. CY347 TaxID=2909336 RepID=UPI001F374AD6|nr:hypothetical protein [Dyadobacter sp. CY347]MCF2487504.1 hypothetical protein [Dyadobacter sp. CY347]
MNEPQRLDSMSKILLATSTINYMANAVNSVISDYQMIITVNSTPDSPQSESSKKIMSDGLKEKEDFMAEMANKLSGILEEFGDYINGCDMVCAIDMRIYNAPCDILLMGKDLVDHDYDNEEAPFA